MNIAIIGCGLIGQKRAKALSPHTLIATADIAYEKAEALAAQHPHCKAYANWQEALQHPGIDMVIIATQHAQLVEIALAALQAQKHILLEKPGARSTDELKPLLEKSLKAKTLVHVGFNHRYHPAFIKARELVNENAIGELMYVRARYGHGGRLGYEKEWRANPAISGGGELIDQGIHLIDLARLFLGDFISVDGLAKTFFWDMPVDDNAFLLLKTAKQNVAFLHASCTEWKNLFCFEIYGKTGKLEINGLGGSYGLERLTYYQMSAAMGPPATTQWEYPEPDSSWATEFAEFVTDIELNRQPAANLQDAKAALDVVATMYKDFTS